MDRAVPTAAFAAALTLAGAPAPTGAAELLVAVTGLRSGAGEVGCALFAGAAGFPGAQGAVAAQWQPARAAGVTCRFEEVRPGTYAVAVFHDENGNRRADTNLVGIPTENWGVSNGVRPALRAPRFEEAAFPVAEGRPVRITVAVASR